MGDPSLTRPKNKITLQRNNFLELCTTQNAERSGTQGKDERIESVGEEGDEVIVVGGAPPAPFPRNAKIRRASDQGSNIPQLLGSTSERPSSAQCFGSDSLYRATPGDDAAHSLISVMPAQNSVVPRLPSTNRVVDINGGGARSEAEESRPSGPFILRQVSTIVEESFASHVYSNKNNQINNNLIEVNGNFVDLRYCLDKRRREAGADHRDRSIGCCLGGGGGGGASGASGGTWIRKSWFTETKHRLVVKEKEQDTNESREDVIKGKNGEREKEKKMKEQQNERKEEIKEDFTKKAESSKIKSAVEQIDLFRKENRIEEEEGAATVKPQGERIVVQVDRSGKEGGGDSRLVRCVDLHDRRRVEHLHDREEEGSSRRKSSSSPSSSAEKKRERKKKRNGRRDAEGKDEMESVNCQNKSSKATPQTSTRLVSPRVNFLDQMEKRGRSKRRSEFGGARRSRRSSSFSSSSSSSEGRRRKYRRRRRSSSQPVTFVVKKSEKRTSLVDPSYDDDDDEVGNNRNAITTVMPRPPKPPSPPTLYKSRFQDFLTPPSQTQRSIDVSIMNRRLSTPSPLPRSRCRNGGGDYSQFDTNLTRVSLDGSSPLPTWAAPPDPFTALMSSGGVDDYSSPPPPLIDSHCHLDFLFEKLGFDGDVSAFFQRFAATKPINLRGVVANFCDPKTSNDIDFRKWMDRLGRPSSAFASWASFSCHPKKAGFFSRRIEGFLKDMLRHPQVVAVGETGLDYSYLSGNHLSQKDRQVEVLKAQARIAAEAHYPLVIHVRDVNQSRRTAHYDTVAAIKDLVPPDQNIHCHCFTGGNQDYKIWKNAFSNVAFGFTNLIGYTWPRETRELAAEIPLEDLLLETDAPFMVPRWPVPPASTQKVSFPGMALCVAQAIKDLRLDGSTCTQILKASTQNAQRIYGLTL